MLAESSVARNDAALTIQARARGRSVRAAVLHDVRFEYERIFRDLEHVAEEVVWPHAGTLCRPRERPARRSAPLTHAPLVVPALEPAPGASADVVELASAAQSAGQAEAERLEVEHELALIRRAMNERLAYLTTQLGELDEQLGEA